jgi:hypothetical protein
MSASLVAARLIAPVLACWLAQAEPAPATSQDPATADGAPAAPSEAAPSEPPPPAEAAPSEPPPPSPASPTALLEPPPPRPSAVGVHARFAYRPEDDGAVAPRGGFSVGGTFERRYATVGARLGLGIGVEFFYDHFGYSGDSVTLMSHLLTQTSFVALQTLSTDVATARLWVGGGAGVTIAYASGGAMNGVGTTSTEVQPVARGAAGVDLPLAPRSAIVVRVDYTHPLTRPTFAGSSESPFGDLIDVGVGYQYRF